MENEALKEIVLNLSHEKLEEFKKQLWKELKCDYNKLVAYLSIMKKVMPILLEKETEETQAAIKNLLHVDF